MQGLEKKGGELLTIAEVATQLGRCKQTIRRWILSGNLKASRVGKHGRFLIDPEDLEKCLEYNPKKTE